MSESLNWTHLPKTFQVSCSNHAFKLFLKALSSVGIWGKGQNLLVLWLRCTVQGPGSSLLHGIILLG